MRSCHAIIMAVPDDDYCAKWAKRLTKETGETWTAAMVAQAEAMMRVPFCALHSDREH